MVASSTTSIWSQVEGQQLDAEGKTAQFSVRRKLVVTLAGSLLLLLCLMAAAIFSYWSFRGPRESLANLSDAFRVIEAQLVSEQVAVIIRPAWTVCRQFVDRLRAGGGQQDGFTVVPPSPETFAHPDQLLAYVKAMAPYFNREVYMRATAADKSEFSHNMFVGISLVLALDANHSLAPSSTCSKAVLVASHLNASTMDTYYAIARYLDENATEKDGQARAERVFDIEKFELGDPDFSTPLRGTDCQSPMRALWGGSPHLDDFYNFTWYGPYNPGLGWGNHLLGSVPIYNDVQEQVGRFSVPISMGMSIGPGLARIIAGSEKLAGGAAALYTETGLVLGLSESAASPTEGEQAATLDELVPDSRTARAVAVIEQQFGQACPAGQHLISTDDMLVDVTEFVAEEYGIPPLPVRWCQVVALPRENIYKAIDNVDVLALVAAIFCAIGFAGAVASFATSVILAIRTQRMYKAEKLEGDMATIREAIDSMAKLSSPMVIVSAEDFLAAEALQCYEDWRDRGRVKYLDSIDKANGFRAAGNLIVFISHQWLGWHSPDCDNVQLKVMQEAVQYFAANEASPIHVWLDFISIAQRHDEAQALAVAALPVYVSLVDRFVICAPDAKHKDTQQRVGLASYNQRGWCRAEMLAKACSSGLGDMYVCEGEGRMRPFVPEDMGRISLSVYEGDFTVKRDAEKLVVPILGLYSLILRSSDQEHMQSIMQYIESRKERFFPHSYKLDHQETRKLFGNKVKLLERHVAAALARHAAM